MVDFPIQEWSLATPAAMFPSFCEISIKREHVDSFIYGGMYTIVSHDIRDVRVRVCLQIYEVLTARSVSKAACRFQRLSSQIRPIPTDFDDHGITHWALQARMYFRERETDTECLERAKFLGPVRFELQSLSRFPFQQ